MRPRSQGGRAATGLRGFLIRTACRRYGCDPGGNFVWSTATYQESACCYCGRPIVSAPREPVTA